MQRVVRRWDLEVADRAGVQAFGPVPAAASVNGTPGDDVFAGTDGLDFFHGGDGDDTAHGFGYGDYLYGDNGNDVIDGGQGDDYLYAGTGSDTLFGGNGNDYLSIDGVGDTVDGGQGRDHLYIDYSAAETAIIYDQRNGVLPGDFTYTNIESVSLLGTGLHDSFYLNGSSRISADGGGGEDEATLDFSRSHRDSTEPAVTHIREGGIGFYGVGHGDSAARFAGLEVLHVIGNKTADVYKLRVSGATLADRLTVDGRGGLDSLELKLGITGSATFKVGSHGTITSNVGQFANIETFALALGSGTNDITLGKGDDFIGYVRAEVTDNHLDGGGGDDLIYVGHGGSSVVYGGAGNDIIHVAIGRSRLISVDGGKGDDQFDAYYSTPTEFALIGGAGNDTWAGYISQKGRLVFDDTAKTVLSGADVREIENYHLTFGSAVSVYIKTLTHVELSGGFLSLDWNMSGLESGITAKVAFGGNVFSISYGSSTISSDRAQSEAFTLRGTNFDDVFNYTHSYYGPTLTLDGGDGIDTLVWQNAVDFTVGVDGTAVDQYGATLVNLERYDVTAAHFRTIVTGAYDDRIVSVSTDKDDYLLFSGAGGDDTLIGSVSRDALHGDDGSDTLSGFAGSDSLDGGAGRDVLDGGDGDDFVSGGTGADRLTGGTGSDRFMFAVLADSSPDNPDEILDFQHGGKERIDVSAIDPDAATEGDQSFTFIGSAAFGGSTGAELRVEVQDDGRYLVQADVDHDGTADFAILVTASAPLVAADFSL